jgi:hypothetical protein
MSNEMGRSLSVHRGEFSAGGVLWYMGGLCSLGSVVGIVQALLGKGAAGQVGVGCAGLVASLGALAVAYNRWKQVLEIFEGGFVLSRPFGARRATREEIEKVSVVTHTSSRGTYVEMTIELTNGKTTGIRGIEQIQQAANLIAGPAPSPAPASTRQWRPPAASDASSSSGWTPPGGAK